MFFSIPNLVSTCVSELEEPWAFVPKDTPQAGLDKDDFIRWAKNANREHAFISGYEGMSPDLRLSADNPAYQMHALVVDYDYPRPPDAIERLKDNIKVEFKPNYICTTPGGNARLVWMLEKPFLCTSNRHMGNFLKLIAKHLRLKDCLGNLDTEAFGNPNKYYAVGTDWEEVEPSTLIPASHMQLWFIKAADKVAFDNDKILSYEIPYEDIYAKVEEKYPGRWRGQFTEGARGVRFWDPHADNSTAAVVMPDGMLCWTGNQAFVPWAQLLGKAFVEKYEAEQISASLEDCAYDGRNYWIKNSGGRWIPQSKEDFCQELRCQGKNSRRAPGATASEIDLIEREIKNERFVESTLPYLYKNPGITYYKRKPILNTSTLKVLEPARPFDGPLTFRDGKEKFPFIYKLMVSLFSDDGTDSCRQLQYMVDWLHHFYVNSWELDPQPGQLLLLAGPAGKGKTFFVQQILANLMGGDAADASSHLTNGDRFTADIAESPIMLVDDVLATSDYKSSKQFSGRIKKYVAGGEMTWEQKYMKKDKVPWFGRIIVLCNTDSESLKILPDMDLSTKDKFSLLKASDSASIKFGTRSENAVRVREELPNFARMLVDREIAASDFDRRFGVHAYHHPDLMDEARQLGIGPIVEVLVRFMDVYTEARDANCWHGTASQLFEDLHTVSPEFMREIKVHTLASKLGKMSKNGYRIRHIWNADKMKEWVIEAGFTKPRDTFVEELPDAPVE